MFSKYIKSEKGSTLIMVLMILTILTIVGTSLLSLSLMNFKMKKMDEDIKESFYWTETALDEAYAKTATIIQSAIQDSNAKSNIDISDMLESEKEQLTEQLELDENAETIHFNSDFSVKENAVRNTLDNLFKDYYNSYINNNLWTEIGDKDNYNTDEDKTVISLTDIINFDDDSDSKTDRYMFDIMTRYTVNNINETIRARFEILVPDYNSTFTVSTNKHKFNENILWTKALIAQEDIEVTSTDVTVDGDVFALGTKPQNLASSKDFGGLVAGQGFSRGRITINGDLSTDSYVHTNYNNSSVTVNGNVFCDSLVVQDGVSNCNININGKLYTEDDIELNGSESRIDINGDFYGFSDGSSVSAGHYQSSSLVFNSPDLGVDSFLNITGIVYLGGTVYINTNPIFQTGESVAFKRSPNYLVYKYEYTEDDLSTLSPSDYAKYEKYKEDNIMFDYYEPLYVADRFVNPNEKLNVFNKRDYIYLYDLLYPNEIIKGGALGISLGNVVHSIGTYVNEGTLNAKDINVNYEVLYEDPAEEAFDKSVNKMNDNTIENSVTINNRFTFPDSSIIYDEVTVNQSRELVYINSSDSALELLGPNVTHTLSNYYELEAEGDALDDSADLKGIIITNGDVYIKGKINYKGTIITTGNIYFQDNYAKTIKHDKNFIIRKMVELNITNNFINSFGPEQTFISNADVSVDDGSHSYLPSDDLVKIINWKKE